jgi:hypothetical protein
MQRPFFKEIAGARIRSEGYEKAIFSKGADPQRLNTTTFPAFGAAQ